MEGKVPNALDHVEDRKWLRAVLEFEAKDLLGVSVYSTVAYAPEEAHDPSQIVKLEYDNERNSCAYHSHDVDKVANRGDSASESINHEPDVKAAHDFANSEKSQSKHRHLELVLRVGSSDCLDHHQHKDARVVSDTDSCPHALRDQVHKSAIRGKLPHRLENSANCDHLSLKRSMLMDCPRRAIVRMILREVSD